MSHELLLLTVVLLAATVALVARFTQGLARPVPHASSVRPEHRAPAPAHPAWPAVAPSQRVAAWGGKRSSDSALRSSRDVMRRARAGAPARVRAIPFGRATQPRGAVRLMILLAPPRAVPLAPLDTAAAPDAAMSDTVRAGRAGEGRR